MRMDGVLCFAIGLDHSYVRPNKNESRYRVTSLPVCHSCGKVFTSKEHLKVHKRTHRKRAPYECFYCDQRFTTPKNLKAHLIMHVCRHYSKECSFCGVAFSTARSLKKHNTKQTCQKDNFGCCDNIFTRRIDFLKHQQDYHDGQEIDCHTCFRCSKNFSLPSTLQSHRKVHRTVPRILKRRFKPKVCVKKKPDLLKSSVGVDTAEPEKDCSSKENDSRPFICQICSKSYTQQKTYDLHVRTHSKSKAPVVDRKYRCNFCHWTFSSLQNRHKHQRIHREERSYQCQYCGHRFSYPWTLANHMALHTGENPYPYLCKECGSCFRQQSTFKNHVATHAKDCKSTAEEKCSNPKADGDEPPNDASAQEKSFDNFLPKECHQSYQEHQRVRAEGSPYQCRYCECFFSHAWILANHIALHTGDFKRECGSRFKRLSSLNSHAASHTNDYKDRPTAKKKFSNPGTDGNELPTKCYVIAPTPQNYQSTRKNPFGHTTSGSEESESKLRREADLEASPRSGTRDMSRSESMEASEIENSANKVDYKTLQDDSISKRTEVIESDKCESFIESVQLDRSGYCMQECSDTVSLWHRSVECKGLNKSVRFQIEKEVLKNFEETNSAIESFVSENFKIKREIENDEEFDSEIESFVSENFQFKREVVENDDESNRVMENGGYCLRDVGDKTAPGHGIEACKRAVENISVESSMLEVYDYDVQIDRIKDFDSSSIEKQKISFIESDLMGANESFAITPNL